MKHWKLGQVKQHGMDVWMLISPAGDRYTFMSEQGARTAWMKMSK